MQLYSNEIVIELYELHRHKRLIQKEVLNKGLHFQILITEDNVWIDYTETLKGAFKGLERYVQHDFAQRQVIMPTARLQLPLILYKYLRHR